VAAVALLLGCHARTPSVAKTRLRLAGGPKDATFDLLAKSLASVYASRLSTVAAEGIESGGTSDNINLVETGAAECGLVSGDLAYNAFLRGTARNADPHQRLRGVAVLFPNTLHLVTRADSHYTSLADLAGRRVAAALPGDVRPGRQDSRMDAVAAAISAVAPSHVRPETTSIGMDEAVVALETRTIDAASFYGGYPFRPVTEAAQRYGIHILEFDEHASGLVKAQYPFLKPIVVPAGTYPGQQHDVRTLAVDNVLICRAELPAELVYQMTRILYDSLAIVAAAHPSGRQINPESGASTPIPLHEGASRYYRERELFR
jgi:uncharacterized protein